MILLILFNTVSKICIEGTSTGNKVKTMDILEFIKALLIHKSDNNLYRVKLQLPIELKTVDEFTKTLLICICVILSTFDHMILFDLFTPSSIF